MKKFTVCLLIGAMAASMLTGCGSNGGSSDSSDSKADSSSETMTIMMNGSDSDAYMEGYRKIIDGFNESNEYGVKVEIQNVTNSDYKTKLTTMMASDSETDIIFTWELGYLENFVNGDKIVSLQKYLDEDEEWKNRFNGGILDPLTYDGEVYAIPTQQSTAIMYYNKAIFDKYGLEVPTTYDEYVQVCDTLKENGVTPVALASAAFSFLSRLEISQHPLKYIAVCPFANCNCASSLDTPVNPSSKYPLLTSSWNSLPASTIPSSFHFPVPPFIELNKSSPLIPSLSCWIY